MEAPVVQSAINSYLLDLIEAGGREGFDTETLVRTSTQFREFEIFDGLTTLVQTMRIGLNEEGNWSLVRRQTAYFKDVKVGEKFQFHSASLAVIAIKTNSVHILESGVGGADYNLIILDILPETVNTRNRVPGDHEWLLDTSTVRVFR